MSQNKTKNNLRYYHAVQIIMPQFEPSRKVSPLLPLHAVSVLRFHRMRKTDIFVFKSTESDMRS